MKFEERLPLTLSDELLAEPVRLIQFIPGVQQVDPMDDGGVAVKAVNGVGPIRLRFNGTARVHMPDPSTLVAEVTLNDALAGAVYGTFTLRGGEGETSLEADVTLGGKLGEFAQPLLRKKARDTVKGFEQNLARYLAG